MRTIAATLISAGAAIAVAQVLAAYLSGLFGLGRIWLGRSFITVVDLLLAMVWLRGSVHREHLDF